MEISPVLFISGQFRGIKLEVSKKEIIVKPP